MNERLKSTKDVVARQVKNTLATAYLATNILRLYSTLALTPDQRKSIREGRDCSKCQFPHPPGDKCAGDLHVHHITPQRWAKEHGIPEEIYDRPENLLTVCSRSHMVHIHPDMENARQSYYEDKGSYSLAFENRDKLASEGLVYWNTTYDEKLRDKAFTQTKNALKGGWIFPQKRNGNK